MQAFEFLSYQPTPNEKYLGIVTIRAWGKIILKYKILTGKNGTGFFHSPSSYKVGSDAQGKDIYEKCFMIDSNYETQQIDMCIRQNVNPYVESPPAQVLEMQEPKAPQMSQVPVFGQTQPKYTGNYYASSKGDDIPF